ncbi:MAG: protein kinase [Pirellulales bacterium]
MHPGMGGACDACGRRYGPQVLADRDGGETTAYLAPTDPGRLTGVLSDAQPGELTADMAVAQADASLDDSLVGRQLQHYRLEQRLGAGGMGAVYRALDESLQRYVAVKVLRRATPRPGDSQHIQRLLQEAIAQARVNHPHIVHIYYVGREGEVPFFAMELVRGQTLAERLAHGPIPYATVVRFALQVIDALRHAEQYDIVHGDLKPGNILLAHDRDVKLADFGLARRLSDRSQEGSVSGTPNYLAPEALAGRPLDVASDQYSLGVTLFEMTFGRLPYAATGSQLLERWRSDEPPTVEFPEVCPKEVPLGWRTVLIRLLDPRPERRFGSYEELYRAVEAWQPLDMPPANRLPRLLAWMLDFILVSLALGLFMFPISILQSYLIGKGLKWVAGGVELLGFVVPALFCLLQGTWQTSVGKSLFQIRIVDRHGLAPPRQVLALRGLFQLLPLLVGILTVVPMLEGYPLVGGVLEGLGLLVFLIDGAATFFSPSHRSLHDRLFDTRVVPAVGRR